MASTDRCTGHVAAHLINPVLVSSFVSSCARCPILEPTSPFFFPVPATGSLRWQSSRVRIDLIAVLESESGRELIADRKQELVLRLGLAVAYPMD